MYFSFKKMKSGKPFCNFNGIRCFDESSHKWFPDEIVLNLDPQPLCPIGRRVFGWSPVLFGSPQPSLCTSPNCQTCIGSPSFVGRGPRCGANAASSEVSFLCAHFAHICRCACVCVLQVCMGLLSLRLSSLECHLHRIRSMQRQDER